MDINLFQLITSIIVGGTATTYVTEFLKLSFVAIPAQKYPRSTAGVISLLSGVVSLIVSGASFDYKNVPIFAATWGGAFVIAAFTYNQTRQREITNK